MTQVRDILKTKIDQLIAKVGKNSPIGKRLGKFKEVKYGRKTKPTKN